MLLDGRLIAIDPSPLEDFGRAYCARDNSTSPEPTDTFLDQDRQQIRELCYLTGARGT